MERKAPKHLLLIDARAFAEKLAIPVFITDSGGDLVFYNEPAESLIGQTFAEVGEVPVAEWDSLLKLRLRGDDLIDFDAVREGIMLLAQRPVHAELSMASAAGGERDVAVTAVPLLERNGGMVGMFAMFWADDDGATG